MACALAGVGDAAWVATTTPFTTGAEAAVATGFLLVAVVVVVSRRAPSQRPVHAGKGEPAGGGGSSAPWLVVSAAVVAFELATYAAGSFAGRHAFPTLSSMTDAITSASPALKGLLAFAWLLLGWGLLGAHRSRTARAEKGPGRR